MKHIPARKFNLQMQQIFERSLKGKEIKSIKWKPNEISTGRSETTGVIPPK